MTHFDKNVMFRNVHMFVNRVKIIDYYQENEINSKQFVNVFAKTNVNLTYI